MKKHTLLFVSSALFLLFIIFTIIVKTVDVQYIYNGTYLGLHDMNFKIGNLITSYNHYRGMKLISNIILYVGIGYSGLIMIFGTISLIKVKSLKALNKRYYLLIGAYVLIVLLFAFFEIVKVNYSPDSSHEHLKASYPSTHVFVGCSLFLLNSYTAIKLLKPEKEWFIDLIYISTGLIVALLTFTRTMSAKHWISDIIASVLLTASVYVLFIYISHLALPKIEEVETIE